MPNTPFHTITELAALLKSQQLSPVEVTRALLDRITQLDFRIAKNLRFGSKKAMVSLDLYNVMNANPVIHAGSERPDRK